jgi:hypothetical protein
MIALLTVLLVSVVAYGHQDQGHLHSKHGFVLVGKDKHFLYHLAKYDSPHQYLGIFSVELYEKGQRLREIPSTSRGILSVLSEETFEISDLGKWKRAKFSAQFFDGYLRSQDKDKIADNIEVRIADVVYFRD